MKLSRYTLFVENHPEPGKHLAYNTRSQALLVIGSELKSVLHQQPIPVNTTNPETRQLLLKLQDLGMTVPCDADELDLVRSWFQTIRFNAKKLEVYVLTSYYCNFACGYCFEGTIKEQKKFLSKEMAKEILFWVKNKAMEIKPETIELVFYGGEPLMNIPILEFMAQEMHEWCKNTPWHFEFSMVTNGALATEDLIDRLNPLGLKYIRVTVDGDKENHDKFRPFISGKGTFDIIMNNVKAVAHKTKVALLGNFNANSYGSIYRLMDYLEANGLKEQLIMLDFKPITERREPIASDAETKPTYAEDAQHWMKMLTLKQELIRRGFPTSKALDGNGVCHFKAGDHQTIIDTDGVIYKCPAMVGQPDKAVGTVRDLRLNERYKDWVEADMIEYQGKCQDCAYVPMCAGGCNYHAELQSGSVKNVFCERDFFDKTIEEFIKIKYQQILHEKANPKKAVTISLE